MSGKFGYFTKSKKKLGNDKNISLAIDNDWSLQNCLKTINKNQIVNMIDAYETNRT